MPQVSKFTNSNGVRLLASLFLENLAKGGPEQAVYTLKAYDYDFKGKHYPSLMKLYLEECDPTEYNFATKYLVDYTHWEMLCGCEWFKEHVERWRRELELKLRASALARLIRDSKEEGREGQSAAKYVLDKYWDDTKQTKGKSKGRPSKDEIKKAAHEIASDTKAVDEHYARLIGDPIIVS